MSGEPAGGGGGRQQPSFNLSDEAPIRGGLHSPSPTRVSGASMSAGCQPSMPATLGVNPRISAMTAGRGPPPVSRMVTHQAPHGAFVPPPGIHGRHHYPMPPPLPPHHHHPPPQMHNMVQHQSIVTRHGGQQGMIPPIVSASAVTHRKKLHPPPSASSMSPSNDKQGSEKSPPSLSSRPPRWTENEVRKRFYLVPTKLIDNYYVCMPAAIPRDIGLNQHNRILLHPPEKSPG
jgi:hypothetical protein